MGCCISDEYGDNITFIVPVRTLPAIDTFRIGDTLTLHVDLDKNVTLEGHSETYYLENFNFFTELTVSEISDSIEKFNRPFGIFTSIGTLDTNSFSGNILVYLIEFQEFENDYQFHGGLICREAGLFSVNIASRASLLQAQDHPAVKKCKNTRRDNPLVIFPNSSTSINRYNELFLKTKVPYLLELIDFERYSRLGSHTFVVVE